MLRAGSIPEIHEAPKIVYVDTSQHAY
jgi:hypothetical protein